jgi:hypothetical protein
MKKAIVVGGWSITLATACASGVSMEEAQTTYTGETTGPSAGEAMAPRRATEKSGDFLLPGALVLPNRSVIFGRSVDSWIESWWRWTFSVPAERNPELVLDADCGIGQTERVYFVPLYDGAKSFERTCRIPFGKPVLIPAWAVINDYPCPDPTFEPAPGQTLEAFLRDGAIAYTNLVRDLTVQWNERIVDLSVRRNTGDLFEFQAHPSLIGKLPDPCLQGTRQPGVSDGYWLMVLPNRGEHVLRVRAVHPSGDLIDQTYRLEVAWR